MTIAKAAVKQSQALIKSSDVPVEDLGGGITRQMLGYGPDLMVCRIAFASGAIGDVHQHLHSQSSYVESGRFRIMIGGKEKDLVAGDAFYVEPNTDHGAVCLEAGVLIDAFSPARADFLASGEQ